MIDCGLFQGLKDLRLRNWAPMPLSMDELTGIVLTHAHIDHSGHVPLVVKNGFTGPILCSEPTRDLCHVLLPDSGYLQEEDARYARKKGFSKHSPAMPLYTHKDAVDCLPRISSIEDDVVHDLGDGFQTQLIRSGHIVGSRFVMMTAKNGRPIKVLFSGDIGRYDNMICKVPADVEEADYLILESTYGGKRHEKEDIFTRFETIINETLARGGKVLIPAFAVGKTQKVLYILKCLKEQKRIPIDIPIYLNTPMGIAATHIYAKYANEQLLNGNLTAQSFEPIGLKMVKDMEESKELNQLTDPAIIVAGSGMLTGGRILHHLKAYAGDPRNTLVMVGFQAPGTRGEAIMRGAKSIKLHGQPIALHLKVELVESMSAHGDSEDILKWLSHFKRPPKMTFLVHGESESAIAMAAQIQERLGWATYIPKYLEEVLLV